MREEHKVSRWRARVVSQDVTFQRLVHPRCGSRREDHTLAGLGRVGESSQLATAALRVGREYGSERIAARVHEVRALLPARSVEVHELDDALAALYEQEAW